MTQFPFFSQLSQESQDILLANTRDTTIPKGMELFGKIEVLL